MSASIWDYNIKMMHGFNPLFRASLKRDIRKQCRPTSDAAERGV